MVFHARPGWLLLGSLAVAVAATPLSAAEIVPTKSVTPNGMTVLVLEQHFLPIVEVHAMVKSGSAHDPPEKAGLANLVASLLDEGTTSRSSNNSPSRSTSSAAPWKSGLPKISRPPLSAC